MRAEYKSVWLTDDKTKVDLQRVSGWLNSTYWAGERSKNVIADSIENSVCFSIFEKQRQIGFARVVSDSATFAWIADVFIDPEFRGQGIATWLIKTILQHPNVVNTESQLLCTKDAHKLYRKFDFEEFECMRRSLVHK